MHHVDAKSIDAALEPKAQHIEHRSLHFRIAPVEIGLLFEKRVIVILSGPFVPFPGAAAEIGAPIIRRSAVWRRIAPDVPVAFGAPARWARLDKPRMVIGSVIGNVIKQ